jgi:tRNA-2-methylthio-N6-dimethylallyladenosine synthase
VLLEKPGRHPGQLAGKSPYLQAVQIEGSGAAVGDIVPVTITALGTFSLFGERADVAARRESA